MQNDWGADISMLGMYPGFMTLPFFIFGLLRNRDSLTGIALVFGSLSLAAALGTVTPVREFFYKLLPFMDFFRNGALFRFFFLLAFTFIAARGWYFWRGTGAEDRLLSRLVGLLAFLGIVFGMLGGIKDPGGFMEFGLGRSRIVHFNQSAGFWAHIAWQGIFSAIFVWFPLWWATRRGFKARGFYAVILVLDLFLAALVLRPATVSYPRSSHDLQEAINAQNEGVERVLSNPNVAMISHISGGGLEPIWYNSNMHRHQLAKDGFNNFHLQAYEDLKNDRDGFKKAVGNVARWANGSIEGIEIMAFSGNQFKIKTNLNLSGNLILTQFKYPGWKVFVDGKQEEFSENKYGFMSVKVAKGERDIQFKYSPGWRLILLFLSAIAFTLLTLFVLLKSSIQN